MSTDMTGTIGFNGFVPILSSPSNEQRGRLSPSEQSGLPLPHDVSSISAAPNAHLNTQLPSPISQNPQIVQNHLLPNGDTYTGKIKNHKFHGEGTLVKQNGESYDGQFADGMRNGKGKWKKSDGSTYEGTWINDKLKGTLVFEHNGVKYTGELLGGKFHGQGCWIKKNDSEPNGVVYSEYTGEFAHGKKDGKGILIQTVRETIVHTKVVTTYKINKKTSKKEKVETVVSSNDVKERRTKYEGTFKEDQFWDGYFYPNLVQHPYEPRQFDMGVDVGPRVVPDFNCVIL